MAAPGVVAIMLANGRPAMVRRAIASFEAQTYPNKRLLIWDSSPDLICCGQTEHVIQVPAEHCHSVGALRNAANGFSTEFPIICHWDSDDYSGPHRIEEQVSHLGTWPDKLCVGYRRVMFWDSRGAGEAWTYEHPHPQYVVGASMCYWREAWERFPFRDGPNEDQDWWLRHWPQCASLSAMEDLSGQPCAPRLICEIHGANTSESYKSTRMITPCWQRTPEADKQCEARMRL
jgi:hypothetical protein